MLITSVASAQAPAAPPEKQLQDAINAGDVEQVQKIIQNRTMLEQFYIGGDRPLHRATRANKPEVVRALLAAGADRDRINQALETPLDVALELKRFEIVRILFDTSDPKRKLELLHLILDRLVRLNAVEQYAEFRALVPANEDLPLFELSHLALAASSGNTEFLEYLEGQGRSLTESEPDSGWTVLHYLAAGNWVESMKQLEDRFTDRDPLDSMGQTPLNVAAAANAPEAVSLLLEWGANANHQDVLGRSALHHAAMWGDVAMARLLVETGADPALSTNEGRTALDIAEDSNHSSLASVLPVAADLSRMDDGQFGVTLAECREAIQSLQLGQLTRLLQNTSANLDATDGRGFALLHYAALQDSGEMIQVLVEKGANVDVQDTRSHWTPLMIAAGGGQLNTVKVLLMNGANADLQGARGMTALHLAFVNAHAEMIDAIRLVKPDETLTTIDGYRAPDLFGLLDAQVAKQQAGRAF